MPDPFQCAGCGFYRPDPSYLLPIEQHINDLRADRETARAMDAADFVIAGLTAQIDSYADIAVTMRQRLAALPDDERAQIEEASAIMRKTRAGGRTTLRRPRVTWLVYAQGVREHIEQAITRQSSQPAAAERAGSLASKAGLRTDLELARAQIRQLRAERDELRNQIRRHLGRQLEQPADRTFTDRIDELTRHSQLLADQHQRAAAENQQLSQRVIELEEELSATRTSLRRMIRSTSRN